MMERGPTIREQAQEFKLRTMELQDWLEDLCETFGNFTYNEIITPWCGYDLVPGRVRGPDGVCMRLLLGFKGPARKLERRSQIGSSDGAGLEHEGREAPRARGLWLRYSCGLYIGNPCQSNFSEKRFPPVAWYGAKEGLAACGYPLVKWCGVG